MIRAGPGGLPSNAQPQRNESRPLTLTTTAGDLELRIPSRGRGRSSLAASNARGRPSASGRLEAYLQDVSNRKADERVRALGAETRSPSPRSIGSARTSMRRSGRSRTGRWPKLLCP